MTGRQRKYLRSLAHDLDPVVHVGKAGLTEAVLEIIDRALADHELIKVRFLESKERKRELSDEISARLGSEVAGRVGHVVILYRPAAEAEDRRIELPGD